MESNTSNYQKTIHQLLGKLSLEVDNKNSEVAYPKIFSPINSKQLVDVMKELDSLIMSSNQSWAQSGNTLNTTADPLFMFHVIIKGYATSSIAVIGLILNIIGVCFLSTGPRRGKILSLMVSSLFAFDAIFLLCQVLKNAEEWVINIGRKHFKTFLIIMTSSIRSSIISSIFMLVAISRVRLNAIRHPFQHNNALLSWKERRNYWLRYCIPIVLSSLILTSPVLLEVEDVPLETDDKDLVVIPSNLRLHPLYSVLYVGVLNLGILGLIPMVCLVYLDHHIRMELKKSSRHGERLGSQPQLNPLGINEIRASKDRVNKVTGGLVGVIRAFIGFHALRILTTIGEMYLLLDPNKENSIIQHGGGIPPWFDISLSLSQLLMVTNASVNVAIYLRPYIKINKHLEKSLSRATHHSRRRAILRQETAEFVLMDDGPFEEGKKETDEENNTTGDEFQLIDDGSYEKTKEMEDDNNTKRNIATHETLDSVVIIFPRRLSRSLSEEPTFEELEREIGRGSEGTIRRRSAEVRRCALETIEEA